MGDAQHRGESVDGDGVGHLPQGQVRGRQGDADDVVGQHHHHIAPRARGQQFGGAGVGDAAGIDRGLVHRSGDHAGELAPQAGIGRLLQRGDDGGGIAGIRPAEMGGRGVRHRAQAQIARRPDVLKLVEQAQRKAQPGRGGPHHFRVGESDQPAILAGLLGKADAEFGPDAGRLTRDQRQAGQHAQPPGVGAGASAGAGAGALAGVPSVWACAPVRMFT